MRFRVIHFCVNTQKRNVLYQNVLKYISLCLTPYSSFAIETFMLQE